jgi:hypothetical protein
MVVLLWNPKAEAGVMEHLGKGYGRRAQWLLTKRSVVHVCNFARI